ncbi:unknown [Clostridium sp. CAG:921]|nr:unknown [Clostridium sp. CAG:921]
MLILAGVPVLNLLSPTPISKRLCDKSFAGNTPSGPLSYETSPIITLPFKYVPVATTIDLAVNVAPILVLTPVTLPFSVIILTISA